MDEPHIPKYLRDLDSDQAALLEKLKGRYNTDCPALLYYIVKERPDIIANPEEGIVDEKRLAALFAARDSSIGSNCIRFLTGDMEAFRGNGTLKSTASFVAGLVDPTESNRRKWPSLFRTKKQRAEAFLSSAARELIANWDNLPTDANVRRLFVERAFSQCKSFPLIYFISDEILKDKKSSNVVQVTKALHSILKEKLAGLPPSQMRKLGIPDGIARLFVMDFEFLLNDSKIAFEKNGQPKALAYAVGIVLGVPQGVENEEAMRMVIQGLFQHGRTYLPEPLFALARPRDRLEINPEALPVPNRPGRDYLVLSSRAGWIKKLMWYYIR